MTHLYCMQLCPVSILATGGSAPHTMRCGKESQCKHRQQLSSSGLRGSLLLSAAAAWTRAARGRGMRDQHFSRKATASRELKLKPLFRSIALEGNWAEVLEAASTLRESVPNAQAPRRTLHNLQSASRAPQALQGFEAGLAFLGPGILSQAGGLAEATAALSSKLGVRSLIACVVDGAVGCEHCERPAQTKSWFRKLTRLRWMRWMRRMRWFPWYPQKPECPVVELEEKNDKNALSLALFQNCGALPLVVGRADEDLTFEEEITVLPRPTP